MELTEQAEGVMSWLEDMRYPHRKTEELASLCKGDFGASLAWLSQHAVGRQEAAHIKRELHRLREKPPQSLSPSLRAQLGLDVWPSAVKEAAELQVEEDETSEQMKKSLKRQGEAERSHSALLDRQIQHSIAITALSDLEAAATRQETRIAALGARFGDWTVQYQRRLDESSASQDASTAHQLLRGVTDSSLTSPASPQYLEELRTMLEQVKTQLRDHVERHQLIRPPPSDEMGEELYNLQQHCLNLSQALKPARAAVINESTDEKDRRLLALAQARARRAALQSETEKLRAEPALPSIAQEAVDEAREELNAQRLRIGELLHLRAELCARIAEDSSRLDEDPLKPILVELGAAAVSVSTSLDSRKTSELEAFATATTAASSLTSTSLLSSIHDHMTLARASRRALHTSHMLDTSSPLARAVPSSAVHQVCDSLAQSRFTLEALRPAIAAQLASPLGSTAAELEQLVRLRTMLTSGKMLPLIEAEGEETLQERWRKGESEAAKAKRAAIERAREFE